MELSKLQGEIFVTFYNPYALAIACGVTRFAITKFGCSYSGDIGISSDSQWPHKDSFERVCTDNKNTKNNIFKALNTHGFPSIACMNDVDQYSGRKYVGSRLAMGKLVCCGKIVKIDEQGVTILLPTPSGTDIKHYSIKKYRDIFSLYDMNMALGMFLWEFDEIQMFDEPIKGKNIRGHLWKLILEGNSQRAIAMRDYTVYNDSINLDNSCEVIRERMEDNNSVVEESGQIISNAGSDIITTRESPGDSNMADVLLESNIEDMIPEGILDMWGKEAQNEYDRIIGKRLREYLENRN